MITLNSSRLGNMFKSASEYFLNDIDPSIHKNAYVGVHSEWFAESEFAGKYLDTLVTYSKYYNSIGESEKAARSLENAKQIVDSIIENQRSDGYIGGLGEGFETLNFSVWNQAFTMLGLISYYEATSDASALECALRIAHFNAELFMSGKADINSGINNGSQHLSILLPLVRLSKVSDDPTVKLFIQYIIFSIRASDNNFFEFKSILDLRSKKGIENFLILIGLLEYGIEFDDVNAVSACKKYWDELKLTQIRENGNGTVGEVWTENGNAPKMLSADMKPDENCVAVGYIEFSLALYYLTHDTKYIDEVEKTVFNHLLGAASLDGSDFAYYQPNFGRRITHTEASMYKCCRYRGYSAVSHIPDMLFLREDDTIHTLLYADSRYKDNDIIIEEKSEYPYGKRLHLSVEAKNAPLKISLRIPKYAQNALLTLGESKLHPNGHIVTVEINEVGKYDIDLSFELSPEKHEVMIDGVKRLGLTYGSVLLAAETDGDVDLLKVDTSMPISKISDFDFELSNVKFTDYASAGREHNFIVWCRAE